MSSASSTSYRGRAARRFLPVYGRLLLAFALCGAAAGCSTDDAGPAVPAPSGEAAEACRALHAALPERVAGLEREEARESSPYTATWGDPAVELRCGVPEPEVLRPGSEHYNPTSDAAEVNGVSWLLEEQDEGYRFTTTERAPRVEVTVPAAYAPEIGALTDLADAVRSAVPRRGS
ncbi:DUF3515 domain-containing protein [Streptomyces hazeniae]|uniref:DUF3515 domain-containing protein n=1 Tax=Streptomyces hazeniae TaxID=3075538 RepID=UPI00374E1D88